MESSMTICGRSGSLLRAEREIMNRLNNGTKTKFSHVMDCLKERLGHSHLHLCTPPSEEWLTVKVHPKKAVLAFVNDANGNLVFDIDTYAHNDIQVRSDLFLLVPYDSKPNKRHVATITDRTSDEDLKYFIQKIIEGINKFE